MSEIRGQNRNALPALWLILPVVERRTFYDPAMTVRNLPGLWAAEAINVCCARRTGLFVNGGSLPSLTQAVWRRFSYPNNWKEPGAMDLEATG